MLKKWILTACLFSLSGSAFGFFDLEAFYGRRWYKKLIGQGSEASIGLNFDPVPLAPLSFGASYSLIDLDKPTLGSPAEARIRELSLNLKTWLTMVPFVTPYLRAHYIAYSNLIVSFDDSKRDIDTRLRGYGLGLGVNYKLIPLIHLQLELSQSWQNAENIEGKEEDLISNSILFGIQIGI